MLVFPPEFTSKKCAPGYVWNMKEKRLYSFKGGQLRPMKLYQPTWITGCTVAHYRISVNGQRRYVRQHIMEQIKHDYKIREVQATPEHRAV